MIYKNDISAIFLTVLFAFSSLGRLEAQEFITVSMADLQAGSVVKGLYLIELGEKSGLYLKEQGDGTLAPASLDPGDRNFYFWVAENLNNRSFQLHSASTAGRVVSLNEDGSALLTDRLLSPASQLMFRMDDEGPLRDSSDPEKIATGRIITRALEDYEGSNACQCFGFSLQGEHLLVFHKSDFSQTDYSPVPFSKTNSSPDGTISRAGNSTSLEVSPGAESQNFVSSLFYVNDFGMNDFQLTANPGAEAVLGFLEFSQHAFKPGVYDKARPKIGLKIADDKISLIYLSGDMVLPSPANLLDGEIETGFTTGIPVFFGFKDQNTFVAMQNGVTVEMPAYMPAELFLNRSQTQSARLLVHLDAGQIQLGYTAENGLISSVNDFGVDKGNSYVSTDPYLPYNGGKAFVNGFNWQKSQWDIRFVIDAGEAQDKVLSPFYSTNVEEYSISAQYDKSTGNYMGGEDFLPTEGWELVKANLGYNNDGTIRVPAPDYPYVIFYDRVSATMRTFVYVNSVSESNLLTVSLGVDAGVPGETPEYTPLLWGSLQQFSTLDQTESRIYSKNNNLYSTESKRWYFYDFVMEYDPCSEFFESSLVVNVEKIQKGDLSMTGRLEGGSIGAGTEEYGEWMDNRANFLTGVMSQDYEALTQSLGDISFNQYEQFNLMDFQTEVNGNLVGRDITEAEKQIAKLEMEAQMLTADQEEQAAEEAAEGSIIDGVVGVISGAASVISPATTVAQMARGAGGGKIIGGIIDIAKGVSSLNEDKAELPSRKLAYAKKLYFENLGDKQPDQAITMPVPPPRPNLVFGELAMKGEFKSRVSLLTGYIATPGAVNTQNALEWVLPGSPGAAPLYNKPMGRYTLLKQPEFGIAIAYDNRHRHYRAYLKTKQKPYIAVNDASHGKIADVFMLSVNVQTSSGDKSLTKDAVNLASSGYTLMFKLEESASLPGEMDISNLISWDIIEANIKDLQDQSNENVANLMNEWISISYEVWSMTLTKLEGRSLENIMSSSSQYFDGITSFVVEETPGLNPSDGFDRRAEELANSTFTDFIFADHEVFGSNYQISNSQENFATVMYDYCTTLNDGYAPDTTLRENLTSIPEIKKAERLVEMKVFPNPAHDVLNFELLSDMEGKVSLVLYNYQGQTLMQTTLDTGGNGSINGSINISAYPAGVYILHLSLPDGSVVSERVILE